MKRRSLNYISDNTGRYSIKELAFAGIGPRKRVSALRIGLLSIAVNSVIDYFTDVRRIRNLPDSVGGTEV
jgi:hypothetical protein